MLWLGYGEPQCVLWRSGMTSGRRSCAGRRAGTATIASAPGESRSLTRWRAWIGQARRGWPGWTARPYVTGFTAITLTELPGSLTTDSYLPQPGHFWLISSLRNAAKHLAALYTPEGSPLPPNVSAELERDIARLGLVIGQIKQIEQARQQRLEQEPERGRHAMVRRLARVVGVGIETADMLVHEVLSRPMRDRKAVARYAGLTGSPDESGAKRREQGLARAGNARVRRGMIQLAWRFLRFQQNSALARWYRARTADSCIS